MGGVQVPSPDSARAHDQNPMRRHCLLPEGRIAAWVLLKVELAEYRMAGFLSQKRARWLAVRADLNQVVVRRT